MSIEKYKEKMDMILNLDQFEKVDSNRKGAKNPILKEEDRINKVLKQMEEEKKLTMNLMN